MAQSNNQTSDRAQAAASDAEKLSETIIEALKELSANRVALTPSALAQELTRKQRIMDMLQRAAQAEQQGGHPEAPAAGRQDIQALKSQNRTLQTHKDRLVAQLSELEEQLLHARAFNKRSLAALLGLLPSREDGELSASVNRLKTLLLEDAKVEDIECCINDLRDASLKDDPAQDKPRKPRSEGSSSFWGKWLKRQEEGKDEKRDEKKKGETVATANHLKRFREKCLVLMEEIQIDAGAEDARRIADIRERVLQVKEYEDFVSINDEAAACMEHFIQRARDERRQFSAFIESVGNGLSELEESSTDSISHAQETHQANKEFNTMLQGQVEDIDVSFEGGKPFEELRGILAQKLAKIKTSIEQKRREDETRLEEAQKAMESLQQSMQQMRGEITAIQEKTANLEKEALIDPLTGVHNRRAYDARIRDELQRFLRYRQVFSLLLLDVDHFKKVNDLYGHWAGDKCLQEIIKRIQPALRRSDFLARYGGEEFVVILPGVSIDGACSTAEKVRKIVASIRFRYQEKEIPLTMSVGVTQVEQTDKTVEDITTRADAAMYKAKDGGRNQTVCMGFDGPVQE